ncbi:MAG: hypothetical protein QXW62_01545 [Candidatus Methanomethylicaceae archaeon]|nr:hypothetical protein [Candidatus Verstraetearchaeota archaeon]
MKLYRPRYILFKVLGNINEEELLFHIKAILLPHKVQIAFKKWPFLIIKIDHKSWDFFKKYYSPKIFFHSNRFSFHSIKTSGSIKKLKEKIKAFTPNS